MSDEPTEVVTFSQPPARDIVLALRRGAAQKCPACGDGKLYGKYLKVADKCPACGEELHHQRADDAPPYFTILIVGHFIVAGVMMVEEYFRPNYWLHIAMWFPLTIGLSLWLLPRIKGALVGLQWALRMHGFGGRDDLDPAEPTPEPTAANRTASATLLDREAALAMVRALCSQQTIFSSPNQVSPIMAKPVTQKIKLLSTAGTGFFYVTKKNPRTSTEKLVFKKYDPVVKKHVEFKETKIK